ncbi:MAG TPA: WhiB family transcriptional regulator [Actinomycetota bacterium]|nr:WhiB family transcriptional regulator [Actinomycetota bacterium]
MASNQEWQDDAACRHIAVELFFPPAEQESEVAKSVCAGCTVRQPCLEFALAEGERFGIWGGLTSQERRSVAAKRRKARLAGATIPEAVPTSYV